MSLRVQCQWQAQKTVTEGSTYLLALNYFHSSSQLGPHQEYVESILFTDSHCTYEATPVKTLIIIKYSCVYEQGYN